MNVGRGARPPRWAEIHLVLGNVFERPTTNVLVPPQISLLFWADSFATPLK